MKRLERAALILTAIWLLALVTLILLLAPAAFAGGGGGGGTPTPSDPDPDWTASASCRSNLEYQEPTVTGLRVTVSRGWHGRCRVLLDDTYTVYSNGTFRPRPIYDWTPITQWGRWCESQTSGYYLKPFSAGVGAQQSTVWYLDGWTISTPGCKQYSPYGERIGAQTGSGIGTLYLAYIETQFPAVSPAAAP